MYLFDHKLQWVGQRRAYVPSVHAEQRPLQATLGYNRQVNPSIHV